MRKHNFTLDDIDGHVSIVKSFISVTMNGKRILNIVWQSDCPSKDDLECFLSQEYPTEQIEDINYDVFEGWLCNWDKGNPSSGAFQIVQIILK